MAEGFEGVIGNVSRGELVDRAREDPGDVHGHVPDAHDGDPFDREIELEVAVIGVPVVPRDEFGGRMAPDQIFPRDTHAPVGLGAGGEGHGMIELAQFLDREVAADFDVAEEPDVGAGGDFVEAPGHGLDLFVVGGHAEADQAVGNRQAFEQIDGDRPIGLSRKLVRQEEPGRTGTDDCDTKRRRHGRMTRTALGMRRN